MLKALNLNQKPVKTNTLKLIKVKGDLFNKSNNWD